MLRTVGSGESRRLLMIGPDSIALRGLLHRPEIECVIVYGSDRKDNGRAPVDGPFTQIYAEDPTSVESILAALSRAGHCLESFDGVYTKDEGSVVLAAVLGQLGGIRTITPDVALRFRDKALQKQQLREAGLPTADFLVIEDLLDLDPASVADMLPAVVKPVGGAGTQETSLARDVGDLSAIIHAARLRGGLPRTYVLESYVLGEEWTANGIVYDGELRFVALGRYAEPCLTTISQVRPLEWFNFSRAYAPKQYELGVPVVSAALSALGLDFGVFHMELFYQEDQDRFVFSECAARRGGGFTQEQTEYQFGVDFGVAAVEAAVGLEPTLSDAPARCDVTGETFLPVKGGYLVKCPDAAELTARPHVRYARIEVPLGARLPEKATSLMIHKIGQIMVAGDSQQTVSEQLAETVTWFQGRVETLPAHASGRELRERTRAAGFALEASRPAAAG